MAPKPMKAMPSCRAIRGLSVRCNFVSLCLNGTKTEASGGGFINPGWGGGISLLVRPGAKVSQIAIFQLSRKFVARNKTSKDLAILKLNIFFGKLSVNWS